MFDYKQNERLLYNNLLKQRNVSKSNKKRFLR